MLIFLFHENCVWRVRPPGNTGAIKNPARVQWSSCESLATIYSTKYINNSPTPQRTVLPDMLTGLRLVKKVPEIDISVTYTQPSSTCPYLEPAQSSPCPHLALPDVPYQYYPPIYALAFQVFSFLQVSPGKPCMDLSSLSCMLHASPISLFSILSVE